MPVKFQKSAKTVKRGSKIVTVEHHYIKNQSKEDLIKSYGNSKATIYRHINNAIDSGLVYEEDGLLVLE